MFKAPKKHYEHDGCKGCIFLGNLREDLIWYDLYYCPQNDVPTVIARYGNEGHEYMSGILSTMNPLRVAKARAIARGFRTKPI
jgi:hypothetical protein